VEHCVMRDNPIRVRQKCERHQDPRVREHTVETRVPLLSSTFSNYETRMN
jgi:hypothetical protein